MIHSSRWAHDVGEVHARYRHLWRDLYCFMVPDAVAGNGAATARFSHRCIMPGRGSFTAIGRTNHGYVTPLPSGYAIRNSPTDDDGTARGATWTEPATYAPDNIKTGFEASVFVAGWKSPGLGADTSASNYRLLFHYGDTSSTNDLILMSYNDTHIMRFIVYTGSGALGSSPYAAMGNISDLQGKNFTMLGVLSQARGGGTKKIYGYRNGVLMTGGSTTASVRGGTYATRTAVLNHSQSDTGNRVFMGGVYVAAMFKAGLGPSDAFALSVDPFGPFRRRTVVVPPVQRAYPILDLSRGGAKRRGA